MSACQEGGGRERGQCGSNAKGQRLVVAAFLMATVERATPMPAACQMRYTVVRQLTCLCRSVARFAYDLDSMASVLDSLVMPAHVGVGNSHKLLQTFPQGWAGGCCGNNDLQPKHNCVPTHLHPQNAATLPVPHNCRLVAENSSAHHRNPQRPHPPPTPQAQPPLL